MSNSGLLRRFGAILYDSLLVLALLFLTTIPFVAVRGGEPVEAGDNLLYQLSIVLVVFLFFTGFWSRSGRTLGMQSWGLRIETPDGDIPTFMAASIRFVVAILSWLPLGLGFFWQLWDKDSLTWHDRLSGTRLRHYPKPGR
ncbi:MAG: RDD family protein [Gammaproteobacteria bacterium]|nr:RDD family protein [Gammaproteobacteria bacterium]MDH3407939.1 RDD family protein [Gammaproteobacteria bacterium]MDH3551489.1 RDD family protein [Gammaproteobacteria bacterium]